MPDIKRISILKKQSLEISDRIDRINPLSPFNTKTVFESGLTFSDISERLDKIKNCSSIIELKESFEKKGDTVEQIMSVSAANYCKQQAVCPVCADRTQSRRRVVFDKPIRLQASLYKDTIDRIEGNRFDPNDRRNRFAYLLTYTILDGDSLSERLEHLKKSRRSWRRMGQRRRGKRSRGEAGAIVAGTSTIEIKRGKSSGNWHAHAHELVFTDREIDYQVYDPEKRRELKKKYGRMIPKGELSKIAKARALFGGSQVPVSKLSGEWLKATGGSSINIHCQKIVHVPRKRLVYDNGIFKYKKVSSKIRNRLKKMSFEDSIAYQSKEALKYFCKPSELTPADSLQVINSTYNKRMLATYGQFRGAGDDDLFNESVSEDDSTFVLVWNNSTRSYGDPIPGRLRDITELELEHDTRSKAGRVTGAYRRKRRSIIESRHKYGASLAACLDEHKRLYRAVINNLWTSFRSTRDSLKRIENANCDKYSPVMAAAGMYIPNSDSRTLYQYVF